MSGLDGPSIEGRWRGFVVQDRDGPLVMLEDAQEFRMAKVSRPWTSSTQGPFAWGEQDLSLIDEHHNIAPRLGARYGTGSRWQFFFSGP